AGRPVGDVWAVSFGSPRGRGAWHAHLPRCRRLPMLRIGALLRLAAARTKPRSPAPVKAPSIRVGVIRKTRPSSASLRRVILPGGGHLFRYEAGGGGTAPG